MKLIHRVSEGAVIPRGYGFVRAKFVEVVDSPVLGGVMAIHGMPAYAQKQHATTIV